MKFLACVIFEILSNLVSMRNSLNASNCWRRQNYENCPTWPHLYFWCTFRICYWFCVKCSYLGCRKMLLISHNITFRENETAYLCVTMRKHARAFVATIWCITFLYSLCRLKVKFLWPHFQTHFRTWRSHFSKRTS